MLQFQKQNPGNEPPIALSTPIIDPDIALKARQIEQELQAQLQCEREGFIQFDSSGDEIIAIQRMRVRMRMRLIFN